MLPSRFISPYYASASGRSDTFSVMSAVALLGGDGVGATLFARLSSRLWAVWGAAVSGRRPP